MIEQFIGAGIMGWLGNQTGKAMAQINTRLSRVSAEENNKVSRAKTVETLARNSLSRYMQSVNNNRMLDDGGDAFTANLINGFREIDSEANRKILSDVKSMEEFGAAAASQAASGAGGQVVDMINSTTALRASISRELATQSAEQGNFEVTQRSKSIMSQMVGGLDGSLIIDSIDTSRQVAQETFAPSNAQAVVGAVFQTAVKAGLSNVIDWGSAQLGSLAKPSQSTPSQYSLAGSADKVKFGWSMRPTESFWIGGSSSKGGR